VSLPPDFHKSLTKLLLLLLLGSYVLTERFLPRFLLANNNMKLAQGRCSQLHN
jgi:hypothetical protein